LAAAARTLQMSVALLHEVRKLSTTRGTGAEVRKFEASVQRAPLTPRERQWLSQVLEAIVRGASAVAAGALVGVNPSVSRSG
jgi:hypothetical protein